MPVWRLKNRGIPKVRKESQTRYRTWSTVLKLGGKRKCALPNTACNWSRGNQCAQLARCVSCSSKTEHTPSTLKFPTPLLHNNNTFANFISIFYSTFIFALPFPLFRIDVSLWRLKWTSAHFKRKVRRLQRRTILHSPTSKPGNHYCFGCHSVGQTPSFFFIVCGRGTKTHWVRHC